MKRIGKKQNSVQMFFLRLKWAIKMAFTIKRTCMKCGTLVYLPIEQKYRCLLFKELSEDDLIKGCFYWRPE